MAKNDTKTEQMLDVLGNGGSASQFRGCCNTKTQSYILDAIDRVQSLEDEVEEIKNNPDVFDIVATYADLEDYDTSGLTDKDIIRVLVDETHDDESTYYRWSSTAQTWTYIGSSGSGGGTSDYSDLENKPSINSVTLSGNKTSSDLGVQETLVSGTNIKTINNTSILGSGNIDVGGGSSLPISFSETQPPTDGSVLLWVNSAYTPISPTGVTVSPATLSGVVGSTGSLTATIVPSGATGTIVWASSNTSVATVNNGTVTYVSAGSATITATIDGTSIQGTCAVSVSAVPVEPTGITVSPSTLTGNVGSTGTITATLTPSGATGTVLWSSSNTNVATVSNGVVTYIAEGSATITATVDGTQLSDTCAVTVNAAPVIEQVTGYVINGVPVDINVEDQTATTPGQYKLTFNGTNDPYNEVGIKNGSNYITKVQMGVMQTAASLLNVGIDESATESSDLISLCVFSPASQCLGFRLNKEGAQTGHISINPTKTGSLSGSGEYIIEAKTEGTDLIVTFTNPSTSSVEMTLTWANLGSIYTPAIGFGRNRSGNQTWTFKVV